MRDLLVIVFKAKKYMVNYSLRAISYRIKKENDSNDKEEWKTWVCGNLKPTEGKMEGKKEQNVNSGYGHRNQKISERSPDQGVEVEKIVSDDGITYRQR